MREIPVDVRIIAATHRDLEQMIRQGEFREDLYYRLNVIPLRILPLRERAEDIPAIAQHLVRKICKKLDRPEICLTHESLTYLAEQPWPGNVRQLENVLERIVNVMSVTEVKPEDLIIWTNMQSQSNLQVEELVRKEELEQNSYPTHSEPRRSQVYEELPAARDPVTWEKGWIKFQIPLQGNRIPLKQIIGEIEKNILNKVLLKYPSSRKAAKVLGVSSTTILNKIASYGIDVARDE